MIIPPPYPRLRKGHILAQGLVGMWQFNRKAGNVTPDIVGNYPDEPYISFVFANGIAGASISTLTAGDLARVLHWFDPPYTVCVHLDASAATTRYLWGLMNGNSVRQQSLAWATTPRFDCIVQTDSTDLRVIWNTSAWVDGQPAFITMSWDGGLTASSALELHVNGVYEPHDFNQNGTGNIQSGDRLFFGGRENSIAGNIDHFYAGWVYDRVLSTSEIKGLSIDPYAMVRPVPIMKAAAAVGFVPYPHPILDPLNGGMA